MRFSIRTKLLLLSVGLLSIPYVGFEYLRETERLLRDNLESSLLAAARTHASALHEQQELFPSYTGSAIRPLGTLFVHALNDEMQLDGYSDDWSSYLEWSSRFGLAGQLAVDAQELSNADASFRLTLGSYENYLYGFVEVSDAEIIYSPSHRLDGDQVDLVFTDPEGRLQSFVFSTAAPGRVHPVERVLNRDGEYVTRTVTNISAVWQPSETGFNLEVLIPLHLVGRRLGIRVTDVDASAGEGVEASAATAGMQTATRPGLLLRPSAQLQELLKSAGFSEGRRVWVLDRHGQVLASAGRLGGSQTPHPLNALYSLILPSPAENFSDDLAGASRLQGEEVLAALAGSAIPRWRATGNERALIVSAGHPVMVEGVVRGAVMVEETTNNIQTLQRAAMANLFNKTIAVLGLVTIVLLVFAARLSMRLRRLSAQASSAIDDHGRVVADIAGSTAADEIGDVSRQLSAMLAKLKQYNEYLEKMAGRLAHELRTPMAVVRSSLENLETGAGNESEILGRAHEGVKRLELLVTRLGEAARLEQALTSSELELLDLAALVTACVEGYRGAYPCALFETDTQAVELRISANPELVVQMLDKLVSNAVDFALPDSAITVRVRSGRDCVVLAVINYGATLPDSMTDDLFNSMISVRSGSADGDPHLGLGLYIVRMIAEFHNGEIAARNLDDGSGVCFEVSFPTAN
jgi:two-component system sensor histidine kinase ChvG